MIAVVELDDGPRVTTTIVGIDADDVQVGQRVRAVFDHGDDGITLLRFEPPTALKGRGHRLGDQRPVISTS